MTPERMRALEAVAEAARRFFGWNNLSGAHADSLRMRLHELDALPTAPPEPTGETKWVQVRGNVWQSPRVGPFLAADTDNYHPWPLLAVITAQIPIAPIPVVEATVTTDAGGGS